MTGFLNDLNLRDANPDPNFLPEGKYPAFISGLKTKDTQATKDRPAGRALIITYKISPMDTENVGKTKTEFKTLPEVLPDGSYKDEVSTRNAAYLKQRLMSFGIPEDQMNDLSIDDVLGTPVWITIVQTGEYYNVRQVELREEESGAQEL